MAPYEARTSGSSRLRFDTLTFAVFVGLYVATKLEPRAGAADGKLMVGLAACAPLALGIGGLLEVVVFLVLRLRGGRDATTPGAFWFYVGSLLNAMLLTIQVM